ncbi:hypothetical protein PBAL39_09951 [Pedobacter sp. BAL39]|uniref:DUF2752 domain-containing protein n=1 Tax=Pedobacter sp. BAL39 TaxID=391596 RepID=UPI000155A1EA|nr:DUF2752 domain-containing protein [Pedobacter sp. BAL39]EDM37458.1 hypothetical protein PBAL39_09951 [Pedobacter sp. BAL39]
MSYFLSAWSSLLEQADNFFLTCPFKYLTGYDCPGCGFQRSLLALLKGDLQQSLHLYPPTIPLLLTFIICLPARYFTSWRTDRLVKVMFLFSGAVVLISYLFKIAGPHQH